MNGFFGTISRRYFDNTDQKQQQQNFYRLRLIFGTTVLYTSRVIVMEQFSANCLLTMTITSISWLVCVKANWDGRCIVQVLLPSATWPPRTILPADWPVPHSLLLLRKKIGGQVAWVAAGRWSFFLLWIHRRRWPTPFLLLVLAVC